MFDDVLAAIEGEQAGRDAIAGPKPLAAPGGRIALERSFGSGQHLATECREADLVVMGPRHPGVLVRWLVGECPTAALTDPFSPLAVAPAGYARAKTALSVGRLVMGSALSHLAKRSRFPLLVLRRATPASPVPLAEAGEQIPT